MNDILKTRVKIIIFKVNLYISRQNMLMFWVGLIKPIGLKPLFLVQGSYLFLHGNKNLF